ncbi:MAG: hypothetical protein IMZ61_03170 [Planctomycetes bacterium]|nr:hypothetical protein [Planctomycetota bacterium]
MTGDGFISCSNYRERPAVRLDLPGQCDLWREMLGYVISRIFIYGGWEWIYKWVRLKCVARAVLVYSVCFGPWRSLRLAWNRGRHWDRKRRF